MKTLRSPRGSRSLATDEPAKLVRGGPVKTGPCRRGRKPWRVKKPRRAKRSCSA
jgi:hypothetical protein